MSGAMTVRDIIAAAIVEGGWDGLYSPSGECACFLDDLAPCGEPQADCRVGVRAPCPPECGEHDWHITEDSRGTPGWADPAPSHLETCSHAARHRRPL